MLEFLTNTLDFLENIRIFNFWQILDTLISESWSFHWGLGHKDKIVYGQKYYLYHDLKNIVIFESVEIIYPLVHISAKRLL